MVMKRSGVLLLCLLLSFFIAACGNDSGSMPVKEESAAGESQEQQATLLFGSEKWGSYMKLVDSSDWLEAAASGYFEALGQEPEPTPGQPLMDDGSWLGYGENVLNRRAALIDAAEALAATEPHAEPLDARAAVCARAMREVLACLREAQAYYASGEYLEDAFARGRAIHSRMLAAWERFVPARNSFLLAVREQEVWWEKKEAARLRGAGMNITAAALDFSQAARNAFIEIDRQDLTAATVHLLELDVFQEYYDALNVTLQALEKAAANRGQVDKERLSGPRIEQVVYWAGRVKVCAGDLMARAAKGPGAMPPDEPRKGSPEKFINEYSSFVNAHTMMRQALE